MESTNGSPTAPIRFSLSRYTTDAEIDRRTRGAARVIERLARFFPSSADTWIRHD
jgi:cysteine sulfinate desulfinase/cysteine desulfurase-like protein